MSISRTKSRPQELRNEIKNILVRHCGSQEVRSDRLADENYQHPENAYLAKYFPKYYQNLVLLMKPGHSSRRKIKRIKKLRRFAGKFHGWTPTVNWFKILGHNRKEIEEFPEICISQVKRIFWAKTALCAVKFFFQITRLRLPTYKSDRSTPQHNFLAIWETFSAYLRNMRKLRMLDIYPDGYWEVENDPNAFRFLFPKLNRMSRLLEKLQVLKCPLRSDTPSDILQNKKVFANLTSIKYSEDYSNGPANCQTISHISLDSFTPPPIENLSKLKSLSIHWSIYWKGDFWSYLVSSAFLPRLKLQFQAENMKRILSLREGFFGYWTETKELDSLDLKINCVSDEGLLFARNFATTLLKKVSRLNSFQCEINTYEKDNWRFEPFLIEGVSHLYEFLKRFKVKIVLSMALISFDLSFLKPFKNLKEIECEGYSCSWVNIKDAVCLLEENIKSGEFSVLKITTVKINYKEEFRSLLKKISRAKKSQTNLQIMLALQFIIQAEDKEMVYLDQFCEVILGLGTIEGLEILLDMKYQQYANWKIDDAKRVLAKYPGLKNFSFQIHCRNGALIYSNKEQLFLSKRR